MFYGYKGLGRAIARSHPCRQGCPPFCKAAWAGGGASRLSIQRSTNWSMVARSRSHPASVVKSSPSLGGLSSSRQAPEAYTTELPESDIFTWSEERLICNLESPESVTSLILPLSGSSTFFTELEAEAKALSRITSVPHSPQPRFST